MYKEINYIVSILNNRINNLEKIKKYTSIDTRLQFANSFIMGKLFYMLPMYHGLNCDQKTKIHRIIMRAARCVLNNYCLYESIENILSRLKWYDVREALKIATLKYFHSILLNKKPDLMFSQLKLPQRVCSKIALKVYPKTKMGQNTALYKGFNWYNQLPLEVTQLTIKQFKNIFKVDRTLVKKVSDLFLSASCLSMKGP